MLFRSTLRGLPACNPGSLLATIRGLRDGQSQADWYALANTIPHRGSARAMTEAWRCALERSALQVVLKMLSNTGLPNSCSNRGTAWMANHNPPGISKACASGASVSASRPSAKANSWSAKALADLFCDKERPRDLQVSTSMPAAAK